MIKLTRHTKNPILKPDDIWWRKEAIFNPGAEIYKNKIILLTRCAGEHEQYISRIGYAESKDGINFKQRRSPVIIPSRKFDKWGCEDPRLTKIGNMYYITYAAISKPANQGGGPPRIALASTRDFKRYKKYGIITPKGADVRDAVLFPEKINGQYTMLHRPFNWTKKDITKSKGVIYVNVKGKKIRWQENLKLPAYFPKKPSVWVCFSRNLKDWHGHKVIMESKENWENKKIGAGSQPVKTNDGWLMIYHSVKQIKGEEKYFAGAVLFDLDTLEIISRTKKPILSPEKKYEKKGHVKNVIFPTGAVIFGKQVYIYYGAADKYIAVASINLKKLLNDLVKHEKPIKKGS